mgnify:CR=1 FL=1
MDSKKIFIMEDDFALRELYTMILEEYGYEVIGVAEDGEEALKNYKNFEIKPDLILMDHRMPGKSGLETAKEIFKLDGNVKIIIASADQEIKEEAIRIGACSFKPKPFNLEKLSSNVKKALKNPSVIT